MDLVLQSYSLVGWGDSFLLWGSHWEVLGSQLPLKFMQKTPPALRHIENRVIRLEGGNWWGKRKSGEGNRG